jgi:hypothetical protein
VPVVASVTGPPDGVRAVVRDRHAVVALGRLLVRVVVVGARRRRGDRGGDGERAHDPEGDEAVTTIQGSSSGKKAGERSPPAGAQEFADEQLSPASRMSDFKNF